MINTIINHSVWSSDSVPTRIKQLTDLVWKVSMCNLQRTKVMQAIILHLHSHVIDFYSIERLHNMKLGLGAINWILFSIMILIFQYYENKIIETKRLLCRIPFHSDVDCR